MGNHHKIPLTRKFEIDPERFPAVVFESDDWCACERVPSAKIAKENKKLLGWWQPKLEDTFELEELFSVIERHVGPDNQKAVFTAFTSVGNPDYRAIRANGFTRYCDIGIDEGFPAPWSGDGIIAKMREGIRRGIWAPEYHSMLHHTSARLWLELLRGEGSRADHARKLFDLNCYLQDRHLPEYEKFTVREQREMIDTGMARFRRAFGYAPSAAVTSDAYPITVSLWASAGINTVSLINCRVNSGEVAVYLSKPWNFQDVYARIGDYSVLNNTVYLTRNAFFEPDDRDPVHFGTTAGEIMELFAVNRSRYEEPTVISTHRVCYVSYDRRRNGVRLKELEQLLKSLSEYGAYFLSSGELGSLYANGWSRRGKILRKWSVCDCGISAAIELPSMKKVKINDNTIGNFLVE